MSTARKRKKGKYKGVKQTPEHNAGGINAKVEDETKGENLLSGAKAFAEAKATLDASKKGLDTLIKKAQEIMGRTASFKHETEIKVDLPSAAVALEELQVDSAIEQEDLDETALPAEVQSKVAAIIKLSNGIDTKKASLNSRLARLEKTIATLSTRATALKGLSDAQAALDTSKQGLDEFMAKVDTLVVSAIPFKDDKDVEPLLSKASVPLVYLKKFANTKLRALDQKSVQTSAIVARAGELMHLVEDINNTRSILEQAIDPLDTVIKNALARAAAQSKLDKAKAALATLQKSSDPLIAKASRIISKASPVIEDKGVELLLIPVQKTLVTLIIFSETTFSDLVPQSEAKEIQSRVAELEALTTKINDEIAILTPTLDPLGIAIEDALKLAARAEEKAALADFTACKGNLTEFLNKALPLIAKAESIKDDKGVNASFVAAQQAISEVRSLFEKTLFEKALDPLPEDANSDTILAGVRELKKFVVDANSRVRALYPILDSLDQAIKESLIPITDVSEVVNKYKSTSWILRMIFGEYRSPAIREFRELTKKSSSVFNLSLDLQDSKSSPSSDIKKADIVAALNKDKTLTTLTLNGRSASVTRSSLFERAIVENIQPEDVTKDTDKVIVRVAQICKARSRA